MSEEKKPGEGNKPQLVPSRKSAAIKALFLVAFVIVAIYIIRFTSAREFFTEKALNQFLDRAAWDGRLYDCDFNQMLGLPTDHGAPDHIFAFDLDKLAKRRIVVGNHCYGCTAGAGSSCQGEVAGK